MFHQLSGWLLADLKSTLSSLRFIEARCHHGIRSVEHLLADYHTAADAVRRVKYAVLKQQFARTGSTSRWVGAWVWALRYA